MVWPNFLLINVFFALKRSNLFIVMNYSYLTTSYDGIVDYVYVFLVEKYHFQFLLKPFMVVDPTSSPEKKVL